MEDSVMRAAKKAKTYINIWYISSKSFLKTFNLNELELLLEYNYERWLLVMRLLSVVLAVGGSIEGVVWLRHRMIRRDTCYLSQPITTWQYRWSNMRTYTRLGSSATSSETRVSAWLCAVCVYWITVSVWLSVYVSKDEWKLIRKLIGVRSFTCTIMFTFELIQKYS